MPKLEPIELEFVFDKKINEEAKALRTILGGVGEASRESAEAIKSSIEAQRKVIGDTEKNIAALEKQLRAMAPGRVQAALAQETQTVKGALAAEKAALNELGAEIDKASGKTRGFLTLKRELTQQLVLMEMAGKRGSAEYEALAERLGVLTDSMGDAAQQARVLAHDNAGLQGVITGVSGLAGAMSAGAGVIGLFGAESESLMKIQTKVQSLMGITIGLQQVANVLNKDSAFMISTVATAKRAWAAAIGILNTKLKISIGLSKALMVSGIGVLIAGITVLVSLYSRWRKSQQENLAMQKEINAANAEAGKEAGKARVEMELTMSRLRNFRGSKRQEKAVVEELNKKYGEAFGQYQTLAGWYDVLQRKSEDYVRVKFLEARVSAQVNKAIEIENKLAEARAVEGREALKAAFGKGRDAFRGEEYVLASGSKVRGRISNESLEKLWMQRREETIKRLEAERDSVMKSASGIQVELDEFFKKTGLFQPAGDEGVGGGGGKVAGREYDAERELQKQLLEIRKQTAQILFEQQEDGLQKRLDQVDREHEAELDKIREFQRQVIDHYNEANNEKPGFTPLSTEDGKVKAGVASISPGLAGKFEEETARLSEVYESRKIAIRQEAASEVKRITRELADNYLGEQERELRAVQEKYASMRAEIIRHQGFLSNAQEQMLQAAQEREERAINDDWFLRTSEAFVTLFGDVSRLSSNALEQALVTAREIVTRHQDQLQAADLESYMSAIRRAEQELRERNPFKALLQSLNQYRAAANSLEKEEALRGVFESGNTAMEEILQGLGKIAAALQEIGALSEENAQTFNEVTGMVKGAMNLTQGIKTQDPKKIIQGGVELVANAITLFDRKSERVRREIEHHKKQLAALGREYRQLERSVARALGTEVFRAQVEQVTNLEKQIQKNRDLIAAEQSKRRKKQDANLIEGYKDAMLQLQNQIEDVYQNIFEGVVQTDAKSLADDLATRLVEAFKSGEDAARAFSEVSSQVLQNAVKNALRLQLLEQPIQNALQGLRAKMGREVNGVFQYDGFTEQEANDFRTQIAAIGQVYAGALKDLEHVFTDVVAPDSSLTGNIKGVTEETASALGGQITAIRIGQADMQALMREQLLHTANIEANTRYNKHLEEIRDILKRNGGDVLRAKGL